jgi:hypothetical protein
MAAAWRIYIAFGLITRTIGVTHVKFSMEADNTRAYKFDINYSYQVDNWKHDGEKLWYVQHLKFFKRRK